MRDSPPPPPPLFSPFSALQYDSWRTGALSCILNIPQSSSNTLGLNKYILKVSKKNTPRYLYTSVFQALCYSITSNLKNNIIFFSPQEILLQLQERDHQKSLFCLADKFCFLVGHLKATCRHSVQKQFLPEGIALHTCLSIKFKPRARNETE